jgi:hypothetical protein
MSAHPRTVGLLSSLLFFALVPALALGQAPPGAPGGGQGQAGGGQGGGGQRGGLSNLVPLNVDAIYAYPIDNSLIVHDPPVDDPNAPPKLQVRGQWLEVVRAGSANVVRRFRALDSPETILTSGQLGQVKVKLPNQTVSYPMRVKLEPGDLVIMTLFAPDDPGRIVYRIVKKDDVHLGDSIVVSGLIAPRTDGGQQETYLQFTFLPVVKVTADAAAEQKSVSTPASADKKGGTGAAGSAGDKKSGPAAGSSADKKGR